MPARGRQLSERKFEGGSTGRHEKTDKKIEIIGSSTSKQVQKKQNRGNEPRSATAKREFSLVHCRARGPDPLKLGPRNLAVSIQQRRLRPSR